ncbi:MAG: tripartite tricarboxylate transporter substrate binding protein [Bradyrhizobium sp.]
MKRRAFGILLAVAAIGLFGPAAAADTWPSQPIKWIVPYAAGGPSDWLARLVGQKLAERVGQPVVIENRAGAGGNIGTNFVAKSPPDGLTIVLGNFGPIAVNRSLYQDLPYDPEKDLAPISLLAAYPNLVLVTPSFGPKSVKEMIALAKASPDKPLIYGSAGVGTSGHLTGEMMSKMAAIGMTHVAYRGSAPGLTDTIAGHLPIMLDPISAGTVAMVREGKLRVLAVTSAQRSPLLPDVPTLAEAGLPGFQVTGWIGVLAPSGTPPAILKRLSDEITAIMQTPEIRDKMAEAGAIIPPLGPDYFAGFIREESERWQKVVKAANIKAE